MLSYFFVTINFSTKLKFILFLNMFRKRFDSVDKELTVFTQKFSLSCQKYGLETLYLGSGKKTSPGSGSATLVSDPILNSPYLLQASAGLPEKNLIPYPGSGSRVRKSTGSRIRIRNNSELYLRTNCRLLPDCWAGWAAVSPPCCGVASPPRRANSSWSA